MTNNREVTEAMIEAGRKEVRLSIKGTRYGQSIKTVSDETLRAIYLAMSRAAQPVALDTEAVALLHNLDATAEERARKGGLEPGDYLEGQAAATIRALLDLVKPVGGERFGPNEGSWWYPDGDTSSDACCMDPSEVIDDFRTTQPFQVIPLERALAMSKVYAAVRVWSETEKDERQDDEDYSFTLHNTEEEARAALTAMNPEEIGDA